MIEREMVDDIERRLLGIGIGCLREVPCSDGWIDLAIRRRSRIAAIECKARSDWKRAVAQALDRQISADEAWICLPFRRGVSKECTAACVSMGIGVLQYRAVGTWPFDVVVSAQKAWQVPHDAVQELAAQRAWRGASARRLLGEQFPNPIMRRRLLISYDQMLCSLRPLQSNSNGVALASRLERVVIRKHLKAARPGDRLVVHRAESPALHTLCGVKLPVSCHRETVPIIRFMYEAPRHDLFHDRVARYELVDCKRCELSWQLKRER